MRIVINGREFSPPPGEAQRQLLIDKIRNETGVGKKWQSDERKQRDLDAAWAQHHQQGN